MFGRACGRRASSNGGDVCGDVVCSGSLGWVAGYGCWREEEGREEEGMLG